MKCPTCNGTGEWTEPDNLLAIEQADAEKKVNIGHLEARIGSSVEGNADKGLGLSRSVVGRTEAGTQALPPKHLEAREVEDDDAGA